MQAFAQAPASDRFEAFNDDTVRDNNTALFWAARDNGGDIDWASAQRHCASLGAGWSLPSTDELLALQSAQVANEQNCIGQLTCRITPLIEVSGLTPWSSENNGRDEAWYVYFGDGQKYAYKSASTQGKRALCVRRT
jgi:hypothetical protein